MNSPYFSLIGRMNRKSYALFGVIIPIVFTVLLFLTLIFMYDAGLVLGDVAGEIAGYLIYILSGVLILAPTVKRLRDIGLNGWFCVSVFIPYIGIIPMLLLLFWPGKPEGDTVSTGTAKL